jgi:hypothetical protein
MLAHSKEFIVVLFFLLLTTPLLYGQDSIVDQEVRVNTQFWIDYNFSKSISETLDISTQLGFRKITPKVYDKFLAISTMNIENQSENKWLKLINSYHLGAGAIYTSNYDANDNFELRFIQGVRYNINTLKLLNINDYPRFLNINNYVRLEERIQTSFSNNWKLGYRLRYKLSTEISWDRHLFGFIEGLYFPLEAEVFFNLKKTDRFNDLFRISPGVGYKTKKGWRFEAFIIFNRTKNITETNNNSNDFILRFRIRDERKKTVESTAPAEHLIDVEK